MNCLTLSKSQLKKANFKAEDQSQINLSIKLQLNKFLMIKNNNPFKIKETKILAELDIHNKLGHSRESMITASKWILINQKLTTKDLEFSLELLTTIHCSERLLYPPFYKKRQLASLILTFSFLDRSFRNPTLTKKDLNRLTIFQKIFRTTSQFNK